MSSSSASMGPGGAEERVVEVGKATYGSLEVSALLLVRHLEWICWGFGSWYDLHDSNGYALRQSDEGCGWGLTM